MPMRPRLERSASSSGRRGSSAATGDLVERLDEGIATTQVVLETAVLLDQRVDLVTELARVSRRDPNLTESEVVFIGNRSLVLEVAQQRNELPDIEPCSEHPGPAPVILASKRDSRIPPRPDSFCCIFGEDRPAGSLQAACLSGHEAVVLRSQPDAERVRLRHLSTL